MDTPFDASVDAPAVPYEPVKSPLRLRRQWLPTAALLLVHIGVVTWVVAALVSLHWIDIDSDDRDGDILHDFRSGLYVWCVTFAARDRMCFWYSTTLSEAFPALGLSTGVDALSPATTVCDAPSVVAAALAASNPGFAWLDEFFVHICGWRGSLVVVLLGIVAGLGVLALIVACVILAIDPTNEQLVGDVRVLGALLGGLGTVLHYVAFVCFAKVLLPLDPDEASYQVHVWLLLVGITILGVTAPKVSEFLEVVPDQSDDEEAVFSPRPFPEPRA